MINMNRRLKNLKESFKKSEKDKEFVMYFITTEGKEYMVIYHPMGYTRPYWIIRDMNLEFVIKIKDGLKKEKEVARIIKEKIGEVYA